MSNANSGDAPQSYRELVEQKNQKLPVCTGYKYPITEFVTPKFYSRYENNEIDNLRRSRLDTYKNTISNGYMTTPRDYYKTPVTSNQVYGWYWNMRDKYVDDLDIQLFTHKREYNAITDIGLQILNKDRKTSPRTLRK